MSSEIVQNIYYLLSLIAFVWMIRRYKNSSFLLLILCMAFEGVFKFYLPGNMAQIMRIVYVVWITYLVFNEKAWSVIYGKMSILFGLFAAFSLYFIGVGLFYHEDNLLLTFSQYSMYYTPMLAMLVLGVYHKRTPAYTSYFNKFFGEVLLIQIFSAIVKYVLFGFRFWEGMVGTFGGVGGGGAGTSFPLVALTWVLVNSNMEIKGKKAWFFVIGVLLIGIAAGKRAVVFLYPALFVLLAIYVARQRYKKGVLISLTLVPLFFYFGLRLTPSLNPENKVWGSFDIDYALDYGRDYSVGKQDKGGNREKGVGRVGGTLLMLERILDIENYTKASWFGNGLKRIYYYKEGTYDDSDYNFGINARGSMTGFANLYLAIGLIGIVLFMEYYWYYFSIINYQRLRWALYGVVMYDFVLYNAQSVREPFIAIMVIFVMYYSQIQYTPSGKFVGQKHPYFR